MRTPLCRSVRSHTFRLSSWIRCQNTGEGVRFLDSHWYTTAFPAAPISRASAGWLSSNSERRIFSRTS